MQAWTKYESRSVAVLFGGGVGHEIQPLFRQRKSPGAPAKKFLLRAASRQPSPQAHWLDDIEQTFPPQVVIFALKVLQSVGKCHKVSAGGRQSRIPIRVKRSASFYSQVVRLTEQGI